MLDTALSIPFWLELAATLIGAFSGAMAGVRARYDFLGVSVIAIITSLSGGVIRDILLQHYGIYALQNPSLILGCCIVALVVFFFGRLAESLSSYLEVAFDLLDNIALALWGIIGTAKALSAGLDPTSAVVLGMLTATGGGVIRDVCMNYEPDAFKAGNFYVTAALVGCSAFCVLKQTVMMQEYAGTIGFCFVLAIRYSALALNWRTTPPIDLSDTVTRAGVRAKKTISRPFSSFLGRVHAPKGKVRRDKDSITFNYAAYVSKTRASAKLPTENKDGKPRIESDHVTLSKNDWNRLKMDLQSKQAQDAKK